MNACRPSLKLLLAALVPKTSQQLLHHHTAMLCSTRCARLDPGTKGGHLCR